MKKWICGLGLILGFCWKGAAQQASIRRDSIPHISIKTVPPDLSVRRLPLFCRAEYTIQKVTGRAVFIRLGSKEYVDYLEQKPNARKF
jgi:hypothetical protein